MVFVHVGRVLTTITRGAFVKPQPNAGIVAPHIYTARANPLFDIDQFGHMNNAAYASHFEYARWEMGAASGLMTKLAKRGGAFIVASMALRFRKELRPMQPFEITSSVVACDERQMWIKQLVREPGADSDARPHAGSLCRAVLRKGRDTLSPIEIFKSVSKDVDHDQLAQLLASAATAERDALASIERDLSQQ